MTEKNQRFWVFKLKENLNIKSKQLKKKHFKIHTAMCVERERKGTKVNYTEGICPLWSVSRSPGSPLGWQDSCLIATGSNIIPWLATTMWYDIIKVKNNISRGGTSPIRNSTSIQYPVHVWLSHHFAVLTMEPSGHRVLELRSTVSPNVSSCRFKGQMKTQRDAMIPHRCQQRHRQTEGNTQSKGFNVSKRQNTNSHTYPKKLKICHLHLL